MPVEPKQSEKKTTGRKAGTGAKHKGDRTAKGAGKGKATGKEQNKEASGQASHVESILDKTFDLVEAGIDLGINLVGKFGALAKDQVKEKFGATFSPNQNQESQAAGNGEPAPTGPVPDSQSSAGSFCVMNRLPILPGGPVYVSFSINNDTPFAPKKIRLEVEGLVGRMTKATLPSDLLEVKPSSKTIAPMDFDKFVLKGTLPTDIQEDTYAGWIKISGDEECRIPVILVVNSSL